MSKLYIFGIGGSGSRVLRSLTMLLASGVDTGYDIVPIIIDPDVQNGDLQRTISLLNLYKSINSRLTFTGGTKNRFFKNSILPLDGNGYALSLQGTNGTLFEKFLNLGGMSAENQAMMRMLFSNNNLSADMTVGFKGNPNIGSIVLNQLSTSAAYQQFANDFVSGDKVFIISSIFGGTGASGFPLLLKNMRTSKSQALQSACIGAVSLLPYFNLQVNDNSAIQADSFISKTKAALKYYEKNVTGNGTLDDMYYLGDDFKSAGYNNADGGADQTNNAHIIELLAATAIIDFCNGNKNASTQFHEFGLKNTNVSTATFMDFADNTNGLIRRPLTLMSILNEYLNVTTAGHRQSQLYANTLGDNFWGTNAFRDYNCFKGEFENWLREMAQNSMAFKPFNAPQKGDAIDIVDGISAQYGAAILFPKKGCDLIDQQLNKNVSALPQNLTIDDKFVELFYTTLESITIKNLKF